MFETYVGTTTGVYCLREAAVDPLGLHSERIQAIYAWRDGASGDTIMLAGSYGNGLYRSSDSGRTWSPANIGLTASAFRCFAPDPWTPDAVLAGTEPARLYRSRDGGQTWQELAGITRIPGHERWFLPYSPRAGALRNVYAPPGRPGRLLASVEVGGLLSSDDGGETWTCTPVIQDEDIHYITGHPHNPDLLYAALGYASVTHRGSSAAPQLGGVARSLDGGVTWRKVETDYTRAVLVPLAQPELLLAGPAPQVGRGGRIVVSPDGGETWQPAGAGIGIPMADMVEQFVAAPDGTVWALCSAGQLLVGTPGEWVWRPALPTDAGLIVHSVAFVPA